MKNVHGGDIYGQKTILDLSANINSFGMPSLVKKAIMDSIDHSSAYPDYACRKLREKLSSKINCHKEWIFCGNGAADVLFTLVEALKPKKALIACPCFAEYEEALRVTETEIFIYGIKEEAGYEIQEDYLEMLSSDMDIAFLCNPNNPTGKMIERGLLLKILDRCRKNNILLVLDESFIEFTDDSSGAIELLKTYNNLFILRSFTKMYAIAGIRLGYGITKNNSLLEKMYKSRQPWSVSIPAQAAGIAALDEDDFVNKTREYIKEERKCIYFMFDKLNILYWKSNANYILFKSEPGLKEKLLQYGILIRDCSNYINLKEGYYRIAVKRHADSELFFNKLEAILNA